jgi:hypothetical protein
MIFKKWLAAVVAGAAAGLVVLSLPSSAHAQSGPAIDKTQMTDAMHVYFDGERGAGPLFLGAGVAAGGIGTLLVTRDDALARGAAYPVFGIGLIQAVVGASLLLSTRSRVAKLDQQLATDPAAFKKDESKRISGVNTSFVALMIVESVLIAGGTATAVVASQKECCRTLQGIGLGLAAQAAVTLSLDLFAMARARDYAESLDRFDPGSSSTKGARGQAPGPMSFGAISFGGRF